MLTGVVRIYWGSVRLYHTYQPSTVQKPAVTAHFSSNQLLLFVFELQYSPLPSSTGILTAEQRQTAVTAYFSSKQLKSKQLMLFVFARQGSIQ